MGTSRRIRCARNYAISNIAVRSEQGAAAEEEGVKGRNKDLLVPRRTKHEALTERNSNTDRERRRGACERERATAEGGQTNMEGRTY